jgi:hypothetical protein
MVKDLHQRIKQVGNTCVNKKTCAHLLHPLSLTGPIFDKSFLEIFFSPGSPARGCSGGQCQFLRPFRNT